MLFVYPAGASSADPAPLEERDPATNAAVSCMK